MGVSFLWLILTLLLFLGLPILIGIRLIIRSGGKSLGYPACGHCRYNLTGTIGTTSRCPECGVEFLVAGILPPKLRRRPWMMWGGVALILAPLVFGMLVLVIPYALMSRRMAAGPRPAVVATPPAKAAAAPAPPKAKPPKPAQAPVPEPLTPQRVAAMSVQEAEAAIREITVTIYAGGTDQAVIDRLREDQKRLQERLAQLQVKVSAVEAQEAPAPEPVVDPARFEGPRIEDVLIGGDQNKHYVLIDPRDAVEREIGEARLLVVFPGGDGSREFVPFVSEKLADQFNSDVVLAMAIAPAWREDEDRIVWPTRGLPDENMKFSTEEFAEAIVGDVKDRAKIKPRSVVALGWSSSGQAVYSTLLQEKTAYNGAFVAMSVFKPEQLPPLTNGEGRAFFILHSPEDLIPMAFPESARDLLTEAGASTVLTTYSGGHGWNSDALHQFQAGMMWLRSRTSGKPTR